MPPTQRGQAYKLGAVDYLCKPIVSHVLRSKVGVFVSLHQKTLELALTNMAHAMKTL